MKLQRRTSFSAPFVLIAGCSGGPRTEPARPPDPIASAPQIDAAPQLEPEMPVDAAEPVAVTVDAAVDAYVPDRFHPPKMPFDPCKLPPAPGNPTCNPPAPTAVLSRIVSVKQEGEDVVIIVGGGRRDGVDKRWRSELVNEGGKTITAVTLQVERVNDNATYVRIQGLKFRLTPDYRIRLSPP